MFAMTPVNMKGGGIGWIYREIWKKRGEDGVTVVRGSGHDNPTIPSESLNRVLAAYPEEERRAREFGDFMHFGGMVYPDWPAHLVDPPDRERIRGRDMVVGIDPGYKRAAFVWVAFDSGEPWRWCSRRRLWRRATALDYARTIHRVNAEWGVTDPLYVLDPYHGHKHGNTDGQTVQDELSRQGIYTL